MTPATMTREEALAAAKSLWGDRGDTVQLGKAFFAGVQRSKNEWDWRAVGDSWSNAIDNARAGEGERKAASAAIKERFARVTVRIDGDVITRNWRGTDYTVKRVDGGFEFAGKVESSLTAIAKIITGARAISGPRFFGVAGDKERAS